MSEERYPEDSVDPDYDNGTMPDNVNELRQAVVGHRIVSAEKGDIPGGDRYWANDHGLVLTLDNGKRVTLADTNDCCAYTEVEEFFLDPASVDHVIMGVGTTDGFSTWHIYADWGDILKLQVGWSCGNPFYYGYGFQIRVIEEEEAK